MGKRFRGVQLGAVIVLADSIEGGMGTACRSELRRLVSEGVEVCYAAPDVEELTASPEGATTAVVRVPAAVRDVPGMLRARHDLAKLVKAKGPYCVVHAHGLRSGMVAAALTSANPIVVTHHGSPDLDPQRRIYASILPKRVWKAISVVPLSIPGWEHWWHWSPVVGAEKSADGSDNWHPAREPIELGTLVIGWFGRVDVPKRPDVWLEQLERVVADGQPARGVVIGDGPLLDGMRTTATRKELLVDFLGRMDPVSAMASMDVLLTWSDSEGVPFVIQEAIALGVPAVTNDLPGPRALLAEAGGITTLEGAPRTLTHLALPEARGSLLSSQRARLQNLHAEGTAEDKIVRLFKAR
jgi:glycosyltransferase involved in cell wall biosynthesis